MPIHRIMSAEVPEPAPGTWSNCLITGGIAYISGMTARDATGRVSADADEYEQARVIFRKIEALVTAAGGTMRDVVKLVIYVTDISQRELVWRARAEFFRGDFPVSTLVQVAALADPALKVEIDAIAHPGASEQ